MSFIHGHALCIGIGSYHYESKLDVPITSSDAQALANTLQNPHYCGYPKEQVTLLTGVNASRESILSALDELADRTSPEDTVLLFYSGHGHYSVDSVYQLTTHDTQFDQGYVKAGTAINQTELLEKLRLIPARRLVLVINACHAGDISPVLSYNQQPFTSQSLPQQTIDAILSTGSGRIIITACRNGQVSYVGLGPLTIFGQALIDGLQGQGISGRAGYISIFDLYTYLYFTIEEAVERLIPAAIRQHYKKQEPELTILKGVGPYPIALYRGSTTLDLFPADHTPPNETMPRLVNPARSQWALEQSISATRAVGITGNDNTVIQAEGDANQVGGNQSQTSGNIVVGKVSGTGIAIGHGARAQVQQNGNDDHF